KRVLEIIDTKGCIFPYQIREEAAKFRREPPSRCWYLFFIGRNQSSIGFAKAVKKEEARLRISQQTIETYGEIIHKFVEGTLADLVYCADEVGYAGFCDTHNRRVIVRAANKNKELYIRVD
ncbi:MAG: hypothetical protein EZS28_012060, partial [Streblomastix strix]